MPRCPSSRAMTRGGARVVAGDHQRADAGALWRAPPRPSPPRAADRSCRSARRRRGPVRRARRDAPRAPRAPSAVSHRPATPSVRSAWPASASLACRISARRAGVERPPLLADQLRRVQRASSTSGAPLVKTMPRVLLLGVAMDRAHQLALGGERHLADARQPLVERVRTETRLARRDQQRALGRDRPARSTVRRARCTAALFARSATASARSSSTRSGPSIGAAAVAPDRPRRARTPSRRTCTRPLAVTTTRTVISFFVSVPVLSEAITLAEPSVSTAARCRTIALRRAMRCTPIDEHRRHDRRQPFGHRRDGQRHAEDEHVEQRGQRRARPRRR